MLFLTVHAVHVHSHTHPHIHVNACKCTIYWPLPLPPPNLSWHPINSLVVLRSNKVFPAHSSVPYIPWRLSLVLKSQEVVSLGATPTRSAGSFPGREHPYTFSPGSAMVGPTLQPMDFINLAPMVLFAGTTRVWRRGSPGMTEGRFLVTSGAFSWVNFSLVDTSRGAMPKLSKFF